MRSLLSCAAQGISEFVMQGHSTKLQLSDLGCSQVSAGGWPFADPCTTNCGSVTVQCKTPTLCVVVYYGQLPRSYCKSTALC